MDLRNYQCKNIEKTKRKLKNNRFHKLWESRPGFVVAIVAEIYGFFVFLNSPNKASAAEGFLLRLYRIAFVDQDFARGSSVAADLPRLA